MLSIARLTDPSQLTAGRYRQDRRFLLPLLGTTGFEEEKKEEEEEAAATIMAKI